MNHDLISELYRIYRKEMEYYAGRVLYRKHYAADIVHDVFSVAHQKRAVLVNHDNARAWLYRALIYQIMRVNAKAYLQYEISYEELSFFPAAVSEHPLSESLPNSLSDPDKEILLLYFERQYSHKQIAASLHISSDTSRQRLSRALRKCRAQFEAST